MKCSKCVHWGAFGRSERIRDERAHRECTKIDANEGHEQGLAYVNLYPGEWGDGVAELFTAGDFGCVLFEPLEK